MLTQIIHRGPRGKPQGTPEGKRIGNQSSPRTGPKVPLESAPKFPQDPTKAETKRARGRSIMILRSWVGNWERKGNQMLTQIIQWSQREAERDARRETNGSPKFPRTEPEVPPEYSPKLPQNQTKGEAERDPRTQYHDTAFLGRKPGA